MGSSSGTSSGSYVLQNSGSSEEDLQQLMDQRKRKRMISNRESARRSRMRKQKHLDDLMTQLTQLRKENSQILSSMNITTQHYLNLEAENSILRAQLAELSNSLHSLNQITITFLNANNGSFQQQQQPYHYSETPADGFFINNYSWSLMATATADMLQY